MYWGNVKVKRTVVVITWNMHYFRMRCKSIAIIDSSQLHLYSFHVHSSRTDGDFRQPSGEGDTKIAPIISKTEWKLHKSTQMYRISLNIGWNWLLMALIWTSPVADLVQQKCVQKLCWPWFLCECNHRGVNTMMICFFPRRRKWSYFLGDWI
jgi:hypothetical protein